ncbi:oocyte zinc finger protein XlCOF7.1-like isoform X2 [Bombina bombina]|uniref:oocyte zinc finger protein XlCOF7.1-like isoform X2 n=1 Tax=Bombina bombina TaxID=8345 RepID=UPI00235A8667|nr:oocyte zinc finger protein XlCOF7.1-like isoform X2 [Bombina bombina]
MSQCYTISRTMNKIKKKLPQQILNHLLEILYLLTGERGANSLTASDMTGDKMTTERILTHTLQIMYLLTGKVPIKCDDVAVYFSMEEWEYIEGHEELYKDVIMETRQALRTMEIPGNESPGHSDENLDTGTHAERIQNIQPVETPSNVSADENDALCKMEQAEDQWQINMPEREIFDNISTGDVKIEVTINAEQTHDQREVLKQEISGNISTGHTDVTPSDGSEVEHGEEPYVCDQVKTEEDEVPINTATGEFTNCNNPSHGQSADTSFNLQNQRSHLKNVCSVCGKCFTKKSYLIYHLKIHTGEKAFSCSDCGKCFTQKSHLIRHQKFHSGVKAFSCFECGKCFILNSDLIRHEKIHTGEKGFSCSVCGKCFTMKSSLIRHQKIHTGEKEFSCFECGKCFILKSDLSRHQKIHIKGNQSVTSEAQRAKHSCNPHNL